MIDTWESCYNLNWKGIITPESFSHPAKFSHALIRRIYQHLLADGLVKRGDTILDPFGGVGLGGLYAAQNGLQWIGCELEPKFVALGQQNIELWQCKFALGFPQWVTPQLIQGDSRRLSEVIGQVTAVISSPPYAKSLNTKDEGDNKVRESYPGWHSTGVGYERQYGSSPGQLGAMREGDVSAIISSPPFAGNSGGRGEASRNGIDAALFDRHSGGMKRGTGEIEGNLDHMPMGNIDAIISSPPYVESLQGNNKPDYDLEELEKAKKDGKSAKRSTWGVTNSVGVLTSKGYSDSNNNLGNLKEGNIQAIISSPPFADSVGSDDPDKRGGLYRDPKRRGDVNLTGMYGNTEGQLGGMKDNGGVAAVVSSPPFCDNGMGDKRPFGGIANKKDHWNEQTGAGGSTDYGQSPNQLGNSTGDTFWQAAAEIVQQCALILPPNGIAVWVTKRYIKNGKIVDFTGQWILLCETLGFELIHHHRAMLVKNDSVQTGLFGDDKNNRTERKSFFRLLHENKQRAAMHWETLNNSDRTTLLALGYVQAFESYRTRIAKNGKAPGITVNRVTTIAQMIAWNRDGKPFYDIDTAIDFEDILCFRRK